MSEWPSSSAHNVSNQRAKEVENEWAAKKLARIVTIIPAPIAHKPDEDVQVTGYIEPFPEIVQELEEEKAIKLEQPIESESEEDDTNY